MPNITNIPAPRVPLIDPKTGLMAREWYMFFFNLFTLTGSGGNTVSVEDLQKGSVGDSLLADAEINARDALNQLENAPSSPQLGTLSAVNQDNVPNLRFSTGDLSSTAGTLSWNADNDAKTLELIMDGGSVVQQIGEETFYRVKASDDITKGQVVMFTGHVGASGNFTAAPATGLTYLQSEYIMGVATQDIPKNSWGYITWFGVVRGVDTTGVITPSGPETWVDGQILYYNPAVTGGLTKTTPTAPNPKVIVAAVINAATNGSLFIRPTFGSALGQTDSNVQITSLANGDILQYKTSSARWENVPASGVVVTTATNLSGGLANQIPYQSAPSTTTFIAAPTTSSFLQYTGSAFAWTATVPIANGGTGATSFAASGSVPYYSTAGSGSLVSSSGFTFNGTTLNVSFSAATTWAPDTEVSRFVTNNTSPTANSAAIFLAQVTYPVGPTSTTGGVKFGAVASAGYSADFVVAPRNNSVYTEYWRLTSTGVVKQLYDASNYVTTTVASNGGVTFDAVGTSPSFTFSDATTFSSDITASVLTASKVVFTDASKKLTSTGTVGVDQGGTGLTSLNVNSVLYASGATTVATDANFTYSATGGYLIQYSSSATWTPDTTLARVQTINTSSTANSAALYLAQVTYPVGATSTTGGVKFGAVASAGYSADFVVANRNAGTYQENLRLTYTGNLQIAGQINGGYKDQGTNTAAQQLASYRVTKVTISADTTLTSTVPTAGSTATIIIATSGTTSRTVTFGTGFKSTGTLATGTTASRFFTVSFVSDGSFLYETARTTAMA